MIKISERIGEKCRGLPTGTDKWAVLMSVLDEYQADVEKRLAAVKREAETAKPFYEQGYGR